MRYGIDALIIINGKDKTDSIVSCNFHGGKCDIVYDSGPRVYSYNSINVRVLKLIQEIDPKSVIFKAKGRTYTETDRILYFGEYYRIIRTNKKDLSFHKSDVELLKNCLYEAKSQELFGYFKETASALSLKTDNGVNILERQYNKITAVEDTTVLAKYLDPSNPVATRSENHDLIYPFGLNQSQKKAVENAFASQISIIQGPPGTGKTQTILNIIANAVRKGKTVAVVSNNNPATQNVAEKLEKQGVSFITAFLGNLHNKEQFLLSQTGMYPSMGGWILQKEAHDKLNAEVQQLSEELNSMLDSRNRIAQIEQELLALKPEQFYFEEYYKTKGKVSIDSSGFTKFPSGKLLSLWLEYENSSDKHLGFIKKLLIVLRFSRAALAVFKYIPEEAIPFLQDLFYKTKLQELQSEKMSLEDKLRNYRFEAKMEELRTKSMKLFKAELAQRYAKNPRRTIFEKKDFRGASEAFTTEYPVILSTTYSIKGTLSTEFIYDYLIVDEASQVDLSTGVLAFSCARNIIIVGDQKQLPNVLTPQDIKTADAIWDKHKFDERYHFTTHSMLVSAAEIWHNVPSVLLREHYRCHPKIAAFFNQKFYNGELIIMTEDHDEENVFAVYRTTPGNHARNHVNQRQIDIIVEELLPRLKDAGYICAGIMAPYNEQVDAIDRKTGYQHTVATVHKFQGRESDAIILSTVDNQIGKFVDNPNLLNVAVSRAIKSLSVIISPDKQNEKTNYGDLVKYIEYNNLQIVDSDVSSVFDLLYKGYEAQLMQYLKKHRRVSEYASENLAYSKIEQVLKNDEFATIGCAVHVPMSILLKTDIQLSEREHQFAYCPLTHIDFVLFNKMDKYPVMVIEVDGVMYHPRRGRQAERDAVKNSILSKCEIPILRLRTDESEEETRIESMLRKALM